MEEHLLISTKTEAAALIEEKRYREAIEQLYSNTDPDPGAEHYALLGLASFHLEKYEMAATYFQKAADADPANPQWQDLLLQAKGNQLSGISEPVPEPYLFEKEKLLRKPEVPAGSLPPQPLPWPAPPLLTRLRRKAGNAIGSVATALMEGITRIHGNLFGYQDRVWTNWYRRPLLRGILTLAYMREKLNKNNLRTAYPADALVGFQAAGQTPPEGVTHFRTADGSWNNLENPKEGAAGTRFGRNVQMEVTRPETETLLKPNPREISRHLLSREGEIKEVPFLNMLAAVWIQFQNHDWVNHGENVLNQLIEVPLAPDDPARKKFRHKSMLVPRTQPDPTRLEKGEPAAVSFINEVTHWWDGSQIYGSDQATVNRLRSGIDGKLNVKEDGTLPVGKGGVEETGFVRNWWIGLSMLHTVFTREHNAICDHLKAHYPTWDDNRLFNVARLINAAIMAKIHSVEWTPAILANQGLDNGLNANWYGLLTNLFRSGTHRKTVAAINVQNPELGGVVGNPINKHGVPYSLTQEFVEVYRLHSLLPEALHLRKVTDKETVTNVPFVETRQAASSKLSARFSFADLFFSFGNQHPGQLVLNNYPKFMQELSIPFNPVYDMAAVDILRARERGVPRYNEFRRQLGLNPIASFEDLTEDKAVVAKLKQVYGSEPEAVEQLDLLVGNLAEGHRPTGFGFGETMFQIFILNATRRLQADRFYTDCYTEEYYTKEGLEWIDQTDFKTVILRHYPELAATGLGNVKNAFEPWDTGKRLDPARHPLRAWDKALKADPWKGDAVK